MSGYTLIFLSLIPVAVLSSHLGNLHILADDQDSDLHKVVNELVESKMGKAIEENNAKIFAEILKQNQNLKRLELKFER